MVAENQDEKKSIKRIKLEHPYSVGSKQITEVNFTRRPKARDMKGINPQNMTMDESTLVLGRCTDLSTPELMEMDLDDMSLVGEALSDFLPNTQRIGRER